MDSSTIVSATDRMKRPDGTLEEPVWFMRGEEMLFGVRSLPADGEVPSSAVLCIHNGGYNMSAHHNQVWARLCRQAARDGLQAFRFDLTGTGDSTGTDIRDPFGQATDDVLGAVHWLRDNGVRDIALVGTCRGAFIGLGAASRVEGLRGVFLCAPALAIMSPDHSGLQPWQAPTLGSAIRDAASFSVVRRLATDAEYRTFAIQRARRRISATFRGSSGGEANDPVAKWNIPDRMAPLRWLVEHQIPVKVYLGRQDPHYRQLEEVRPGVLGQLIDNSPNIELDVVEGSVHRFISIEGQDRFLTAAQSWLETILPRS